MSSRPPSLDPLASAGEWRDSANRLHIPTVTAADPSPKCVPSSPGLMGSVVPGEGQAGRMMCLYLCGGIEPQSFTGSLGAPKVSLSLLVFRDSVQLNAGTLPVSLQHQRGTPIRCPWPPAPIRTLGGRACPFKSGPADITAGGWGGMLARLPAPRPLQDPAQLCARLPLWGPRPGTPLPTSSSLPDPRLRPRPG